MFNIIFFTISVYITTFCRKTNGCGILFVLLCRLVQSFIEQWNTWECILDLGSYLDPLFVACFIAITNKNRVQLGHTVNRRHNEFFKCIIQTFSLLILSMNSIHWSSSVNILMPLITRCSRLTVLRQSSLLSSSQQWEEHSAPCWYWPDDVHWHLYVLFEYFIIVLLFVNDIVTFEDGKQYWWNKYSNIQYISIIKRTFPNGSNVRGWIGKIVFRIDRQLKNFIIFSIHKYKIIKIMFHYTFTWISIELLSYQSATNHFKYLSISEL
jgi:hypothetical protein